MSQENVEAVRAVIDGFNRGDWDAALDAVAPNVVYDNSRAMGEQRGIYRGREEVRELWVWLADLWDAIRIDIDETLVSGGQVLVPLTIHFCGRDGIEVQARPTWLFTVRGHLVQRVCMYQTKEEALEAVGPSE